MKVAIFGKTNVGKSTLFKALTLKEVEIADRPFTTISPNFGVGYVTVPCPEKEFGVKCNPKNAPCKDGIRYVPVEIIDVAGLIKGAAQGRGLGNKFLTDAASANIMIEVIDASGRTDENGNPTEGYDPLKDVELVKNELTEWLKSIILRSNLREGLEEGISKQLSGIQISKEQIKQAIKDLDIKKLDENSANLLAEYILSHYKKIVIAINKSDLVKDPEEIAKRVKALGYESVICSAEIMLMLREAESKGYISIDKENNIKILKKLSSQQLNAIELGSQFLKKYGDCLSNLMNKTVIEVYHGKVVFPVEDENKLTDSNGNVLPDAYVMDPDSTLYDLALKIHSDIASNLKLGIDCKTKMKIGKEEKLKHLQVIKLVA
ncbi:MAG: YchF-related putative GTPase [Candidatus Rehaiarchaeum fermentans]|nr:YchF-related putative GTPase [Candidatus Rehaiarchaeum fermentans]MCW1297111.1 YchF-related putative GTPase [Candidatus Rehaiarchaeum fermentans]MCW1302395.1 YchF-related putative GTPase [Candidatus Rehaiarchaeum fermentans]